MHSLKNWLMLFIGAMLILMAGCTAKGDETVRVGPDNTWVVIMDKETYPEGFTDTVTDFVSAKRMQDMFAKIGVKDDNMRVVLDQVDRSDILDSLEWLSENADKDDVVFFYVTAHGEWLIREVMWEAFIAEEWLDLNIENKVLMVDACRSGKFVKGFDENPDSGMSFSVVSSNEIAWIGLEEEGLPIVGTVWAKYFTDSVFDKNADANGDKLITMEEAIEYTNPRVSKYMKEEVFAVDEFLNMYHDIGIYPFESETYPNPVFSNHLDKSLVLWDMNDE